MRIKSHEKTNELRAKLEALYQSKDLIGISEPPAVVHFGVMAAENDRDHRYLVINANGYSWSPDIDAATKMEMKIANALKIAIQDEHGMLYQRRVVLIALR
jgi:hypothetical protein